MPSWTRLRILRAALELETFTAKDVSDEIAIPLEAVRTAMKRHGNLFEDAADDVGVPSARRPGRPPRRYRLRDAEAARQELTDSGMLTPSRHPVMPPRTHAERTGSML